MLESLQESIQEQNKLLQEILKRGGLETLLKDIEIVTPPMSDIAIIRVCSDDYNEAKQQVNSAISWRLLETTKLYGEIKYLSQVIPKQYENFKRIKQGAPNGVVHKDIDNFIKRYEEEHENL
jgi:hypothetical protein|nr:MAG TPA: hypothetical protein [Caudoviricetes sp.]